MPPLRGSFVGQRSFWPVQSVLCVSVVKNLVVSAFICGEVSVTAKPRSFDSGFPRWRVRAGASLAQDDSFVKTNYPIAELQIDVSPCLASAKALSVKSV